MERIYMDHSATTPMTEKALAAMLPFFREEFGNPSAIYSYGQTGSLMLAISIITVVSSILGGAVSDFFAARSKNRVRSRSFVLMLGYVLSAVTAVPYLILFFRELKREEKGEQ